MNIRLRVGIAFCVFQSVIFFGFKRAFFSLSRMPFKVDAPGVDHDDAMLLSREGKPTVDDDSVSSVEKTAASHTSRFISLHARHEVHA